MLSLRTLGAAVIAIALLQPVAHAYTNRQSILPDQDLVQKQTHNSPGCEDVFYATMHVARNSTSGDEYAPVVYQNGRVYATETKEPTHWRFKKGNNGGYLVTAPHPSRDTTHWWSLNLYEGAIEITSNEYQAKEIGFAQNGEEDTPFATVTAFWEDRCLVVPDDHTRPLQMLQLSSCETVSLNFSEPMVWKRIDEICNDSEEAMHSIW